MSRPYKRTCPCGREFVSRSNGRVHCYQCSPAQHPGKGGDAITMGMTDEQKDRMKMQESYVDKEIALICVEADNIESAARSKPAKFSIGANSKGDRVVMAQRPPDGWGKCRHFDADECIETCDKERFSETSPFCYHHLQHWRMIRAQRVAARAAGADDVLGGIPQKLFRVTSVEDAQTLLSRIGKAAELGQITSAKADTLVKVVESQLKCLMHARQERIADAKIELIRKRAASMGRNPGEEFTEEELAELESDAKKIGQEEEGENG